MERDVKEIRMQKYLQKMQDEREEQLYY